MQQCKDIPIYVIDFEGSIKTGIIEYGIVGVLNGKIFETETRICKAFDKISDVEFLLHKISFDETVDKQPFEASIDLFLEKRQKGPFCAHNAIFEEKLLSTIFPIVNNIPRFFDQTNIAGWGPWIDTYAMYRRFFQKLKKFTLSDLINTFNLTEELYSTAKKFCPPDRRDYHCALFDAIASALLLNNFLSSASANLSIQSLLIHSSVSKKQFGLLNQPMLPI